MLARPLPTVLTEMSLGHFYIETLDMGSAICLQIASDHDISDLFVRSSRTLAARPILS